MKIHSILLSVVVGVSIAAFAQEEQPVQKRPTPRERKLYAASNSTEAVMTYRAEVQIASSTRPTAEEVNEAIENQVRHLFGTMSVGNFGTKEIPSAKSVPKGDHTITNKTAVRKVTGTEDVWTVTYNYRDTIVLEERKPLDPKTYNVVIPLNPGTIYAESEVSGHYPCTDHHYQSEGDFWYFWNPKNDGCNLKKDDPTKEKRGQYSVVTANVARTPNTKVSYPEYKRLVAKNADGEDEVLAYVFFGLDKEESGKDPNNSSDTNAINYRAIRGQLERGGFEATKWKEAQIREIAKTATGKLPFVEDLVKVVNGVKLKLVFFFGATGIDENSTAFHWFYKESLENSAIMLYGGHSGLGGHLLLESIEANLSATTGEDIKIRPNKSRYQIYYFDSCSSYPYYNKDYFARKATPSRDPRGTKNLDIFTNGLATYFSSMPNSTNQIIAAVEDALEKAFSGRALVSYQTLAKSIDDDNLFGVNGDEDNPPPENR